MLAEKKVLVTGCAGFLGPWVCELLLELGVSVVGLDRVYPDGSRIHALKDRVALRQVDIESFEGCRQVIAEDGINVIFHLAAQAIVGVANENPLPTFASNIMGTWNLMEAARLQRNSGQKIEAIVVASSDKAYGDQENLPYLEDAPMQGRFPYDVSKSCTDLIARSYFHSYGLPVCITRCGNLYGGGDLHLSRIVPGTILSVLKGERPVVRSDGSPVRDYIYVQDAARANIAIASRMLEDSGLHGQAFNISNDAPVSVLEIVELICKLMGRADLKPIVEGQASREIQAQYLSSEKIRALLGWAPEFELEDGLGRAISWYREWCGVAEHSGVV
ncbi:MAG: GDP-mannose 4,6-dehydratase [Cyanobacteria bacterium SZAS TMP-1]|nr:GDP-mannose 4,6-dehydratase [Cyanobacteria bacterium SZAS TMP-1]